ncbi:MAG: hypothetical protein NT062_36125 [Proteobacteria bacterium]|nr:hypothetical protein [Pseudomonadota bacterium]
MTEHAEFLLDSATGAVSSIQQTTSDGPPDTTHWKVQCKAGAVSIFAPTLRNIAALIARGRWVNDEVTDRWCASGHALDADQWTQIAKGLRQVGAIGAAVGVPKADAESDGPDFEAETWAEVEAADQADASAYIEYALDLTVGAVVEDSLRHFRTNRSAPSATRWMIRFDDDNITIHTVARRVPIGTALWVDGLEDRDGEISGDQWELIDRTLRTQIEALAGCATSGRFRNARS